MDKRYTADEFRQIADAFEPHGVVARIHNGIVEREIFARDIVAMLRQAADSMDREKKYEYARVLSDGSISCTHFDEYAKGYYKFRREVGEWEEMSNG